MLKEEFIEPANTDWASSVVLVPNPEGFLRFCIDYRRINSLTVKDAFTILRMDECIGF